ncbi:MAG: hypothetical protein ACYTDU_21195, partial [Planctomycetota bacterium]
MRHDEEGAAAGRVVGEDRAVAGREVDGEQRAPPVVEHERPRPVGAHAKPALQRRPGSNRRVADDGAVPGGAVDGEQALARLLHHQDAPVGRVERAAARPVGRRPAPEGRRGRLLHQDRGGGGVEVAGLVLGLDPDDVDQVLRERRDDAPGQEAVRASGHDAIHAHRLDALRVAGAAGDGDLGGIGQ